MSGKSKPVATDTPTFSAEAKAPYSRAVAAKDYHEDSGDKISTNVSLFGMLFDGLFDLGKETECPPSYTKRQGRMLYYGALLMRIWAALGGAAFIYAWSCKADDVCLRYGKDPTLPYRYATDFLLFWSMAFLMFAAARAGSRAAAAARRCMERPAPPSPAATGASHE